MALYGLIPSVVLLIMRPAKGRFLDTLPLAHQPVRHRCSPSRRRGDGPLARIGQPGQRQAVDSDRSRLPAGHAGTVELGRWGPDDELGASNLITPAQTARRLNRWEFLFTAAPLRIDQGMGSPLNPIATF